MMNRNDFIDLASNDHKGALIVLFDELNATQETVADLAAALPEPEETPA